MYQDIKALQATIRRLCNEKGITINKLATLSSVTQSTIDSIMKGKSKNPKLETLRKIANGLDIEYDKFIAYIRSAQEEINPSILTIDQFTHETGLFVANRLKELRNKKNVTLIDVCNETGAFIDYEERIKHEDFSVLITLADYFNVSLDYLVGRSDDPTRH